MRILIINGTSHNSISGASKYARELIDILKKKHRNCHIDDYYMYPNKANILDKEISMIGPLFNTNKSNFLCTLSKYWKFKWFLHKNADKYDLFIFNLNFCTSIKKISAKSISVQHTDYSKLFGKSFFRKSLERILFVKSHLLYSNTLVVFSNDDKNLVAKKLNKSKSIYPIKLFADFNKMNKSKKREDLLFIGRNDFQIKRIDMLLELSQIIKYRINLIMDNFEGIDTKKYHNISLIKSNDKNICKFLSNSLATILVSDFEGFSFVLLESLYMGTPIIVRNTFLAAKTISNSKNSILLDKNLNSNQIAEIINNYDFSKFDNNSIMIEARQTYSKENFHKQWISILNKHLSIRNNNG